MYSAVLMLALTAGSDSVDFGCFRSRCHGACTATAAAPAAKASCSSSCHSRQRLFGNRCHASHGCSSSKSCTKTAAAPAPAAKTCSSSHGCHGGGFLSGLRNRGCSRGCATTSSTCSGTTKKAMPGSEEIKKPKTETKKTTEGDVSSNDSTVLQEGRIIVSPVTVVTERRLFSRR